MLTMTALFTLTTSFSPEVIAFRTCIPKTQFLVNGRLCHCDLTGRWTEKNCEYGPRTQPCKHGQITWNGCNQCKCNDNGELQCTDFYCYNQIPSTRKQMHSIGNWCIPLKYYRVNCSICLCPASGQTSEAHCTVNATCLSNQQSQSGHITSVYDTNCIPNVMYVFPCLQCLCSDDGKFLIEMCYEVCQTRTQLSFNQKCKPDTFYRRNCNVCRCPQNGIPDNKLCTNTACDIHSPNLYLVSLKMRDKCVPYTFTKSRCFFCDCDTNGTVNENSCLRTNCTTDMEITNSNSSGMCNSEEIVPVCMECFCHQNGSTEDKYCTKACNYESKLNVLEKVVIESKQTQNIIQFTDLQREWIQKPCKTSSVYFEEGKYCICINGSTEHKFCKTFTNFEETSPYKPSMENEVNFNANTPCQPNTFVEFDCNTCYCSKSGKIDPKWCTYDDCTAIRLVQDSHKLPIQYTTESLSDKCNPGSISKEKCNYCICPDSGLLKERACTKNYCSEIQVFQTIVKFTCEPLEYYEVDCNICYCPSDGLKNVARCTKNLCDKNFLRSDTCIPGQLFSVECNVCLCPPNGNKNDRVCTNHTCPEVATWSYFKLSEKLFEDRIGSDTKRSLDICFPGEQFMIGCKHCVCPETGLKVHAECDVSQCSDKNQLSFTFDSQSNLLRKDGPLVRIRRDMPCIKYNVSLYKRECTPGTMYIVRCKQCICPYMGNIVYFCRPLPKNMYCEQPFPNVQYEPMSRRGIISKDSDSNIKSDKELNDHKYTKYKCTNVGNIMDKCFICECDENNELTEEHCFKSEDEICADARPTFLIDNKVIVN